MNRRSYKGKYNPAWKGGMPDCIDCGKKLSRRDAKRCSKCANICQEFRDKISQIRIEKGLSKGKNNPMYGKKRIFTVEHRKKISIANSGINSSSYIDGRSLQRYPSEFNNMLRQKIIIRDGYKCQNCGLLREDYLLIYDRDIEVHHIDYNKQNCQEDNLITTCKQCNLLANYDRLYWKEFYQNKIKELLRA